jgi:hypothetical protein
MRKEKAESFCLRQYSAETQEKHFNLSENKQSIYEPRFEIETSRIRGTANHCFMTSGFKLAVSHGQNVQLQWCSSVIHK